MKKLKEMILKGVVSSQLRVKNGLQNQKGASMVEVLGYSALAITAVVILHGLITGWLPGFFQDKIMGRLETL